jgi:hypothetical protein
MMILYSDKSFYLYFKAVDSRSGFRSFLNENQIQSETRAFTIITRVYADFRFSR